VENNFFITRVGIGAYESKLLSTFPKLNRDGMPPTQENLKNQLNK
jgi:hypothetical protein